MNKRAAPEGVIRRLPKYLRYLECCMCEGVPFASSADIAMGIGTNPSQVRQDLNFFGDFGMKGAGYSVSGLRAALLRVMGIEAPHRAVLVGVGGIGRAVLEHFDLKSIGCALTAAFEAKPELTGQEIGGVMIKDVAEMETYLQSAAVSVCMIAVTDSRAQGVADTAVNCGISAIVNFTNGDICAPHGVFVENIHIYDSLMRVSYFLSNCG